MGNLYGKVSDFLGYSPATASEEADKTVAAAQRAGEATKQFLTPSPMKTALNVGIPGGVGLTALPMLGAGLEAASGAFRTGQKTISEGVGGLPGAALATLPDAALQLMGVGLMRGKQMAQKAGGELSSIGKGIVEGATPLGEKLLAPLRQGPFPMRTGPVGKTGGVEFNPKTPTELETMLETWRNLPSRVKEVLFSSPYKTTAEITKNLRPPTTLNPEVIPHGSYDVVNRAAKIAPHAEPKTLAHELGGHASDWTAHELAKGDVTKSYPRFKSVGEGLEKHPDAREVYDSLTRLYSKEKHLPEEMFANLFGGASKRTQAAMQTALESKSFREAALTALEKLTPQRTIQRQRYAMRNPGGP